MSRMRKFIEIETESIIVVTRYWGEQKNTELLFIVFTLRFLNLMKRIVDHLNVRERIDHNYRKAKSFYFKYTI